MPIFDYKCKCGHEEEKLLFCCYDAQLCPECGELMERQFSAEGQKFSLKYNNKTDMCDWSGNTSRYWDDVKKQNEGKITVPVTENIE